MQWSVYDSEYTPIQTNSIQEKLETGVYTIHFPPTKADYLRRLKDDFKFEYTIYGIHDDLINRTTKVWKNTNGNLGLLLNGLKGTGKSVTAKMICNIMSK